MYMRIDVLNNSGQAWVEFQFELQEILRPAERVRRRPVVRPAQQDDRQHLRRATSPISTATSSPMTACCSRTARSIPPKTATFDFLITDYHAALDLLSGAGSAHTDRPDPTCRHLHLGVRLPQSEMLAANRPRAPVTAKPTATLPTCWPSTPAPASTRRWTRRPSTGLPTAPAGGRAAAAADPPAAAAPATLRGPQATPAMPPATRPGRRPDRARRAQARQRQRRNA